MDDLEIKLDRLRRVVRRRLDEVAPRPRQELTAEEKASAAEFLRRVEAAGPAASPQWRTLAEMVLARLRRT